MLHVMYKNPGRAGCPPNLVISQYSCSVLVLSSKKEIANLRGKDECEFFHGIKIVSGARLL